MWTCYETLQLPLFCAVELGWEFYLRNFRRFRIKQAILWKNAQSKLNWLGLFPHKSRVRIKQVRLYITFCHRMMCFGKGNFSNRIHEYRALYSNDDLRVVFWINDTKPIRDTYAIIKDRYGLIVTVDRWTHDPLGHSTIIYWTIRLACNRDHAGIMMMEGRHQRHIWMPCVRMRTITLYVVTSRITQSHLLVFTDTSSRSTMMIEKDVGFPLR